MKRVEPQVYGDDAHTLLRLLGEELKRSLVAISQHSEFASSVGVRAREALKTLDAILLYHRLSTEQTELLLEPVHVGASMQTVAHGVEALLREAGCSAELHIQHGLQPVTADRKLLEASLYSLWHGFLQTVEKPSAIVCSARRVRGGVRVAIHSESSRIDTALFSRFHIESSQPFKALSGPATNVVAACGLLSLIEARVSRTAHRSGAGLGFTLAFSKQLELLQEY